MTKTPSVTEVLHRLTGLSQELAGAFRPATIVELVARAITEQLAPERLSIMLLDVDSNRLVIAYHDGPRPAITVEPADAEGGAPWTLAVQWHPEDLTERALFDGFARAVA